MKPQKQAPKDFERVSTDDFIPGVVEDIAYEEAHLFKGYGKDKKGTPIPDRTAPAVRFKFLLEGYKYPHYSRWMSFNYGEKSNIYLKFLVPLVEGAKPDMDFDLDQLKGLKVKILWAEKNDFQFVETIRPIGKKVVPLNVHINQAAEVVETGNEEEVPF